MRNKTKIYKLLLDKLGCGPFDGGCIVMARALQIVHGGLLVVLLGRSMPGSRPKAQHACVLLDDGRLIDADGPLEPQAFIARYLKNELQNVTSFRALRDSYDDTRGYADLSGTDRDEGLSKKIAKLLTVKEGP